MASYIRSDSQGEFVENINDEIATAFCVQVGFVEGILVSRKSFPSVCEMYKKLFAQNKEYAILLWYGIPVRLSYQGDIPFLIKEILSLLKFVITSKLGENHQVELVTDHIVAKWELKCKGEDLEISADWHKVDGNYTTILNNLGLLVINKTNFLNEWKVLILQLLQAFLDSKASLKNSEDKLTIQEMIEIENQIQDVGKLYNHHF